MDLYDESRTLVYTGPVLRRVRTETGFSEKWSELVAALLDNYCKPFRELRILIGANFLFQVILMKEEKRPNGSIKRLLMSRVRINFRFINSYSCDASFPFTSQCPSPSYD